MVVGGRYDEWKQNGSKYGNITGFRCKLHRAIAKHPIELDWRHFSYIQQLSLKISPSRAIENLKIYLRAYFQYKFHQYE